MNYGTTNPFVTTAGAQAVNLGSVVPITNKASGGSIGTAATTVDIAGTININQTTASQTLTMTDPTDATVNKTMTINNVGSQSFTFTGTGLSTTIPAGHGIMVQWTGAAYSLTDGGGGSATTPSSVAATGAVTSSSPTAGIGYSTGAGAAGTQGTSRTTTIVVNGATGAMSGSLTLFSAAGSATPFSFTVTNAAVAATDTVIISQKSGTDKYETFVTAVGAGSFQVTAFTTGGTTTETPVFNFAILRSVAS